MTVERQLRTFHTPWGSFTPAVDTAPLIYMLVLYGVVYFLPFGVFEAWTTGEDGPVEWLQFAAYAGACVCSLRVLWLRRRQWRSLQGVAWLLLTLFLFYVAAEEIIHAQCIPDGMEGRSPLHAVWGRCLPEAT